MNFSIQECLAAGWETFKRRPGFFVLVNIGLIVISVVVSGLIDLVTSNSNTLLMVLAGIAQFILQCFMSLAMCRITLHAVDDVDAASFNDAWAPQFVLQFALGSLLYSIMITLGMFLLIVPGLILGIVYSFWFYPTAERGTSALDALSFSRLITRGHRWRILFFFLLPVLINVLGFIALLVGMLVTIPVTTLAAAHAYRVLVAIADARAAPAPA